MDDMILTIAERLKDLRKDRGLTLEALAEATKISRSALGTYEPVQHRKAGRVLRSDHGLPHGRKQSGKRG